MADTRFKSENGLYVVGDAELTANLSVGGTLIANGSSLIANSSAVYANVAATFANNATFNGANVNVNLQLTANNLAVNQNANLVAVQVGNTTQYTIANTTTLTAANLSVTVTSGNVVVSQGNLTLSAGNLNVTGQATVSANTNLISGILSVTANNTLNKVSSANAVYEITQGTAGYGYSIVPATASVNTGTLFLSSNAAGFNFFGTKSSANSTSNTTYPYGTLISYNSNTGTLFVTQGANTGSANGALAVTDAVLISPTTVTVNLQSTFVNTATFSNTVVINGSQLTANTLVVKSTTTAQGNVSFEANATVNVASVFTVGNSTINTAVTNAAVTVSNSTVNAVVGLANVTVSNSTLNTTIRPGQINVGTTISITNTGINAFASSNTKTFVNTSGIFLTSTPSEVATANQANASLWAYSNTLSGSTSAVVLSMYGNSTIGVHTQVGTDLFSIPVQILAYSGSNTATIWPNSIGVSGTDTTLQSVQLSLSQGVSVSPLSGSGGSAYLSSNSTTGGATLYLSANSTANAAVRGNTATWSLGSNASSITGNYFKASQGTSNTFVRGGGVYVGETATVNTTITSSYVQIQSSSGYQAMINPTGGIGSMYSSFGNSTYYSNTYLVTNATTSTTELHLAVTGPSGNGVIGSNYAIFNYTTGIKIPASTTANRPGTGTGGYWLRFNTTVSQPEISYSVGDWRYILTSTFATTPNTQAVASTLVLRDTYADIYANNFYSTSDVTLKENLSEITGALDKLDELTGYIYNFIGDDKRQYGLSAQNVEKTLPEAVGEKDGLKAVSYQMLIPVIIEAIKELKTKVNEISNGNKSKPRS